MLSAALVCAFTLAFSPVAQADDLDASVTQFHSGFQSFPQMAQVYTALHTGQLYQIAIYAGTSNSFFLPATVEVHNVSSGVPSTAMAVIQAQTSMNNLLGANPGWHTFTLNPRVRVTANMTYSIVTTAGTMGNLSYYLRWGYTTLSNANFTGGKMLVRMSNSGAWSPIGTSSSAFDFETWVSTGVQELAIAADRTTAQAQEGTAPTMTGTYSGNAGSVTLGADHGTVLPGGTAGTWSWTGDLYEEDNAPPSVTITVTDSATGESKSTTFLLSISGASPTVSISIGGAQAASLAASASPVAEGTTLTLNASGHSADAADQADGLNYSWTVTRNGVAIFSGAGSSYTLATMDEGTYIATVTARDDGGMTSDPASVTVVANEIVPTPTITSIAPTDPAMTFVTTGEALTFAGTKGDPSPEWHSYIWDFGDGAQWSGALTTSHTYTVAKTYIVTLSVSDDEGVTGTATATVKVLSTQDALAAMIRYVQGVTTLNAGQQNSLIAKLNAASDSVARGNNQAAHNQLNAFLNELEADLRTGKLSKGAYNTLRADAHAVTAAMGTFNRFVEWWPLPA